jgi:hypothetical protein
MRRLEEEARRDSRTSSRSPSMDPPKTRVMSEPDQRALRAAADAYDAARQEYENARTAADTAYDRLHASPETLEYQIDWNVSRRAEAAAANRLERAEQAYREAGGYIAGPDE